MQIAKKQARTTSKYAIAKYTQAFSTSNITASQRTKTTFFLIVPPQCYWPLLHVQTICFQTYVKFLLRLQNPARFALSRDAVSGDFYWLTSYCCQSWLYMRNIVLQPLQDTLSSLSLASLTSCICELVDLAGQKKRKKKHLPHVLEKHII